MVSIRMDSKTRKSMAGVIGRYTFEVGVLRDKPHMKASEGFGTMVGKEVAKATRQASGKTVAQVSREVRAHTGKNFYLEPMKKRKNADLMRLVGDFFKVVKGRGSTRRLENTLQAVVRNPIARGDYGKNTPWAQEAKGFNWLFVHTGQLFKNITGKVKRSVQK